MGYKTNKEIDDLSAKFLKHQNKWIIQTYTNPIIVVNEKNDKQAIPFQYLIYDEFITYFSLFLL